MKVASYGAGSVGGYFGGRLAEAGADVHLIAREIICMPFSRMAFVSGVSTEIST